MIHTENNIIADKLLMYMGERNLKELLRLFAEEVDWDVPGNAEVIPWLGSRKTKEEIKVFYELLWEHTEPLSAHISKVLWDAEHTVIIGEFTTLLKVSNNIVNSYFCIHFIIENGLIVNYRLYENSFAVNEAFKK